MDETSEQVGDDVDLRAADAKLTRQAQTQAAAGRGPGLSFPL